MYYNIAWVIPKSQKKRTFTIFLFCKRKIAFYCGDVALGSKLFTLLHKMADRVDAKRMATHPRKSDVRPIGHIVQFYCLIFVYYSNAKRENKLQLRLQERLRCFILGT